MVLYRNRFLSLRVLLTNTKIKLSRLQVRLQFYVDMEHCVFNCYYVDMSDFQNYVLIRNLVTKSSLMSPYFIQ